MHHCGDPGASRLRYGDVLGFTEVGISAIEDQHYSRFATVIPRFVLERNATFRLPDMCFASQLQRTIRRRDQRQMDVRRVLVTLR